MNQVHVYTVLPRRPAADSTRAYMFACSRCRKEVEWSMSEHISVKEGTFHHSQYGAECGSLDATSKVVSAGTGQIQI